MSQFNPIFRPISLADKLNIDKGIEALFAAKANPFIVANYIREYYFSFTYYTAYQILRKQHFTGEHLLDATSELAEEVMNDILSSAENGKLLFRAAARFSTYLEKAIEYKKNARTRIYYPTKIKQKGVAAKRAYYLLLVKHSSDDSTRKILINEFNLSNPKITDIFTLVKSFFESEMKRANDRLGGISHHSLDQVVEITGDVNLPSHNETPENILEKKELLEQLRYALDHLEEPDRSLLIGIYMENRSIAEMEKTLNINNGKYSKKRAEEKLKNLLK